MSRLIILSRPVLLYSLITYMSNARLSTYMKPDFLAWKLSREHAQIRLRSQLRTSKAEISRLNAFYTGCMQKNGLQEVYKRLINDENERNCANNELLVELTGKIQENPGNEVALGCLALLKMDILSPEKEKMYLNLLPTLLKSCQFPSTVTTAVWLVTNLCKSSVALSNLACELHFLPLLFGLMERCVRENEDCMAISWSIRQLIDYSPEIFQKDVQIEHIYQLLSYFSLEQLPKDVISDCVSSVKSLCSANSQYTDLVLSHSSVIISVLASPIADIQEAGLILCERLMTASYVAAKVLCEGGILPWLDRCIVTSQRQSVVLWTVSILCQNLPSEYIPQILHLQLFPRLLGLLIQGKTSLLEPGLWSLINLISLNDSLLTSMCISWKVAPIMLLLAQIYKDEIAVLALDCMMVLIETAGRRKKEVVDRGMMEVLEDLQFRKETKVAERAENVLEMMEEGEQEEEMEGNCQVRFEF